MFTFFEMLTSFETKLPLYLVHLGFDWNQEHVLKSSGHPYLQWIQCTAGEGKFIRNNQVYSVKQGQGMLINANDPHEFYATQTPWKTCWVSIGGYGTESIFLGTKLEQSGVYQVSEPDMILNRLKEMIAIHKGNQSGKSMLYSKCLYEILLELIATAKVDDSFKVEEQIRKITPVIDYIEQHYNKVLTLEELAKILNVTPEHFCSIFKSATGMRVFEYINGIRIKNAKEYLLINKEKAVKEIASMCGFEDTSYFCAVFKKYETTTPAQFRKTRGL